MSEPLFNSAVTVCIKCTGHDDRTSSVRVQLEIQTASSPLQRKELNVRLTDDADPFFLFNLMLGEDDFQSLKVQQGLLVDFTAFPQKLIELLQRCAEEQSKDAPKFVLQLIRSEPLSHGLAELCIVETNPFKHLTHLALKLQPGGDADVKKYLASCLKRLQGDHNNLSQRLKLTESTLSGQLQESQKALSARTRELESLRSEWSAHTDSLNAKHKQEIAEIKQNALQTQRDMEQRYEQEKKQMEDMRQQRSSELQSRLADLQTANKELTDRKYRLESSVRELKGKLTTLEEDYQRAQHELQALRQQRGSLESDQRSREQTLSQQQTRIAVMQQEVRDKEALLAKSNQLMESANEQKAKLEESIQHKNSLVAKLESTVKSTSQEVMKGNEIIKKLQGELKASLAKLKLKNTVTGKQEKLLEERNQTLRALQQDADGLKTKSQQLENENDRMRETLESTRTKLEESRQLLKTNENVINWLNKQVNEAQMSKRHGMFEVPTSTVAYRPQGVPAAVSSSRPWPMSSTHLTNTMSTIPQSTPMGYNSSTASAPSTSKRSEPALDPKYLQHPSQHHSQPPGQHPSQHPSQHPGQYPTASARDGGPLQKSGPVPLQLSSTPMAPTAPAPSVPPLMSAYFPPQLKGTT
ncbi:spindle assembly abnormal protein 6 homolog [Patiria miniata]|uniref:Spindle assembly abnormal protein 6 homolog n=1 Tax=Patiria miniata TaxID=46514 RepID=A0A913ZXX1_PATMI|nr:spindle assembly abnormal protein 6 homolog [Patiria miniata]XP_038056402.1 spindle assembly abnormal protein 6 homolog [Patiria miniata]